MKDPRREANRWLEQADHDLRVCQWMLKGNYYSDACFHAQQCAEKALKAFLYFKGLREIRGHSVADPINRCLLLDKDFNVIAADASDLDFYYVQTRYPNALPGSVPYKMFGSDHGNKAVSIAGTVLSFVRKKVS